MAARRQGEQERDDEPARDGRDRELDVAPERLQVVLPSCPRSTRGRSRCPARTTRRRCGRGSATWARTIRTLAAARGGAVARWPRQRPTNSSTNVVRGRADEVVGRRVLRQDAAVLEHRDAVAQLHRLVDVVGDEDDRLAQPPLEREQLVLQPVARDRVDGAERLVHEQQRRVRGERARDAHALALAAAELRRIAVGHVRIEADERQELLHPRPGAGAVPAQQARDGGDVLGHGPMGEQADLLDRVADLPPQRRGLALADGAAVEADVARRELGHAVDEAHRRRLAAARRAHQDAHLAGADLEGEVLDGGGPGAAVGLRDVVEHQGDGLWGGRRPLGVGGGLGHGRGGRISAGRPGPYRASGRTSGV